MRIPLDFNGIIALANELGLILTPLCVTGSRPKCCVIAVLAIANGFDWNIGFKRAVYEKNPKLYSDLTDIELGFERPFDPNRSEFTSIGKQLREYSDALYNSQNESR